MKIIGNPEKVSMPVEVYMQYVYIPVGAPTFDLEVAGDQFRKSCDLMKTCFGSEAVCPEKMLLSIADLKEFIGKINPDFIILQGITFSNGAFASEVVSAFKDVPLLLWTLKEPVIDGKRLRLNSLTGAFSSTNAMRNLGKKDYDWVFGSPENPAVKKAIIDNAAAVKTVGNLKNTKVAAIGLTPEGFGFGRALDSEIQRVFGSRLLSIEAREMFEKAKSYSADEVKEYEALLGKSCKGSCNVPSENMEGFARLMKAYTEYCKANNVGIIGSRCWPDCFVSFGTPVCAVLSLLNDSGISAACESDMFGAISMYIAQQLSSKPAFFGDPVSLDVDKNTVTFWHCGMCAPSLSDNPELGLHPNRHIGPVMDFGCKASDAVTVFRIGKDEEGKFRAITFTGSALDMPKQFIGASVVVKTDGNAHSIVESAVKGGWEPHYVVAYGDISSKLECTCRLLGIPLYRY